MQRIKRSTRAYSRNLGQHSISARKGTYEKTALFIEKGPKESPPPPPIQSPF